MTSQRWNRDAAQRLDEAWARGDVAHIEAVLNGKHVVTLAIAHVSPDEVVRWEPLAIVDRSLLERVRITEKVQDGDTVQLPGAAVVS